jgi:hypothetical protein
MSFEPEEYRALADLSKLRANALHHLRYYVDFYDAFDGWGGSPDFHSDRQFSSLDAAKVKCDALQEELRKNDRGNIAMGEHYGVIDLNDDCEVYCGKKGV